MILKKIKYFPHLTEICYYCDLKEISIIVAVVGKINISNRRFGFLSNRVSTFLPTQKYCQHRYILFILSLFSILSMQQSKYRNCIMQDNQTRVSFITFIYKTKNTLRETRQVQLCFSFGQSWIMSESVAMSTYHYY